MRLSPSEPWVLLGVLLVQINISAASLNQTLPCEFLDSKNISAGVRHEDGSISFEGVDFPKSLYAEVDYDVIGGQKVPVKPHLRGCFFNVEIRNQLLAYGKNEKFPFYTLFN